MDHLTAEQLAELRRLLEQERERLSKFALLDDVHTEVVPLDRQERAARDRERSAGAREAARSHARLREVEAALARLRDGSYGVCEETGDPIAWARLRAAPTARYSVEAQEALEQATARADKASDDEPLY